MELDNCHEADCLDLPAGYLREQASVVKLCKYPPLSVAGWRVCSGYSHRARLARDVHKLVAVTRLSLSPSILLLSENTSSPPSREAEG